MINKKIKVEQEMIDDNTLGIGEWDYDDVMDLSSKITYKLQDLKLIKGGENDYNFEVDDEIREIICKNLNVKEEE
tara:strand:+ start:266 stop:490 length:225 start_codon:yes stop_codon:yes gene_type:complete